MSVQALSWVLENSKAEHAARLTLISIANHADNVGNNAWPSVSTIARESRLSERVVQSALRQLEALGELKIIPCAGPNRTNLFTIPPLHPAESAPRRIYTPQNYAKEGAEFVGAIRKNRPEPSLNTTKFVSKKVQERNEKDRRARLTEITKAGKRDYKKYPREDWE